MVELRRRRLTDRRPGGFRTVWLNVYGWGALVATGLMVGVLATLVAPLPLWIALVLGILTVWGALLIFDQRRYLNSIIGLGDDNLDRGRGAAIVNELKTQGISAAYDEFTDEDEEGVYIHRAISCRQRHAALVRQVMAKHLNH